MSRTTTKIIIAQEDGTVVGQYFLGDGEHLIGRKSQCTIQLVSNHVSREHARLIISAEAIEIEDLDSTTGTFVDGVPVKGRIPIEPGQKLWISELYIDIERQEVVEGSRLGNDDITMSGQWYYTEDGAQYGPVDEAEIIRMIQDGELPISTPVLLEGHMDWQPARDHACFQLEIYPQKKRTPVEVAASTASKPASEGASQSVGQAGAVPIIATSSPVVTPVALKGKSALPWVFAGVAAMATMIMAVILFFGDVEETQLNGDTQPKPTPAPIGVGVAVDDSKGPVGIVGKGEAIVINPAGSGGTRYLLVEIYLVRANEEDKTFRGEIETNSKKLQSLTMDKLSERNIEELSNPAVRKQIENVLKNEYQTILGSKHPIKELVVTKWVMQ